MGRRLPFLFSLGSHCKETDNEGDLPSDVSFVHPLHLSFANHVHDLVSLFTIPSDFCNTTFSTNAGLSRGPVR
jgi:hypothetical protein